MFTTQGNLVSSNCSGTLFGFKADPANQVASIRMATRPPIRFYLSSFRICNYKSSPLFRSDKKLDECIGKTHPGGRIQQGAYLHRLSRSSPYFQIIKDRFSFRCLANENLIELRFAESTISVDKNNILSIYKILYTAIKLSIKFWSRETIKISFCIRIVNKMDERETETERERGLVKRVGRRFGRKVWRATPRHYVFLYTKPDRCLRETKINRRSSLTPVVFDTVP